MCGVEKLGLVALLSDELLEVVVALPVRVQAVELHGVDHHVGVAQLLR